MSHDPYRPETAIGLALERPFPMEDSVTNEVTAKRCPTCDAHSCSCAKEDAEIERILSMPDDELLAEAVANGEDVHALAEESRALFAAIADRHRAAVEAPDSEPHWSENPYREFETWLATQSCEVRELTLLEQIEIYAKAPTNG